MRVARIVEDAAVEIKGRIAPVLADVLEAEAHIAAHRALIRGGDIQHHGLEAQLEEIIIQKHPERLGAEPLADEGRAEGDAEPRLPLTIIDLAQRDPPDQLA